MIHFNEELNEEHGVAIWSDAESALIVTSPPGQDYLWKNWFTPLHSLSECVALDMFTITAIAQRLIRELGPSVTPQLSLRMAA
uniref:Uncharacterized protein n=1 Tax=Salmonella sp. TaxID=599 RepID=A0A482ETP9_SALSP|nr:hypothetical protein NNIBIDOC_00181 [Salmonella sp.]